MSKKETSVLGIEAHRETPGLSPDNGQARGHRVTIYVTAHCLNCSYAREVAATIREEYPHIDVQLVDLADSKQPVPETVFATPTYLLDGRVWSLGNPSPDQIREALRRLE